MHERQQVLEAAIRDCQIIAQYLGKLERKLRDQQIWFAQNPNPPDYAERVAKHEELEERKNEQRQLFMNAARECARHYGIVVHDHDDYHTVRNVIWDQFSVDYRNPGKTESDFRLQWRVWLKTEPDPVPF
jgi:hypothetical protein